MKRKQPMPSYYGRNIVRNAQKKFLQCKTLEAERKKREDCPEKTVDSEEKR